jgi:hypothetical protein
MEVRRFTNTWHFGLTPLTRDQLFRIYRREHFRNAVQLNLQQANPGPPGLAFEALPTDLFLQWIDPVSCENFRFLSRPFYVARDWDRALGRFPKGRVAVHAVVSTSSSPRCSCHPRRVFAAKTG